MSPINVYLLSLLFLRVFVFMGYDSWTYILNHQGPWDHVKARWEASYERGVAQGECLWSVSIFIATGRKPAGGGSTHVD